MRKEVAAAVVAIVLFSGCGGPESAAVEEVVSSANAGGTGDGNAADGADLYQDMLLDAKLSPTDLIAHVKSNPELNKTRKVLGVEYRLMRMPASYLVCNDLKKKNITGAEYEKAVEGYLDLEYYQLQIEVPGSATEIAKVGLESQQQYQERIKYLAFDMQNDITVECNGKVIPCEAFHFERTYNTTPYSTFIIGFPSEAMSGIDLRTVVLDDHLFNNGLIKFAMPAGVLLPGVELKEP